VVAHGQWRSEQHRRAVQAVAHTGGADERCRMRCSAGAMARMARDGGGLDRRRAGGVEQRRRLRGQAAAAATQVSGGAETGNGRAKK